MSPLRQFLLAHIGEHLLARCTDHDSEEGSAAVGEIVGGLIVDDIAARLPERLARAG
jgi:hypothetical protein